MPASPDSSSSADAAAENVNDTSPSRAFSELFRKHADDAGRMPFDRFMALALYDPALGYYRKRRARVGYGAGTDFFTASTSGVFFGELVCAAAEKLLADKNARADDYVFVEIGAEPDSGGVLAGVSHPFAGVRLLRAGDDAAAYADALRGRCVIFSNELFDAQPFRRFVFREGRWREIGVALTRDGKLEEVLLAGIEGRAKPPAEPQTQQSLQIDPAQPEASPCLLLPANAPEGWHLDLPVAATQLAREIAAHPWSGLFLAFDYGKSWRELTGDTPAGTARAYHRHTQSNDLLARPGEQDLTCHICWDWLAGALAADGFGAAKVESQEAFFIGAAAEYLARAFAEASALPGANPRKRALMQLLHPAHLGQKFQALHAWRA